MAGDCIHCGNQVPAGASDPSYCCQGCATVYRLLHQEGLSRYYQLAGNNVTQVTQTPGARSLSWLEPLAERAEATPGEVCSLELDIQGLHCAACVWLLNEVFRRQEGGADLEVNPALGKVRLRWLKGRFDLAGYLRGIERFGYLFGPGRKQSHRRSLELPVRMGISAVITTNVMLFSIAFYFGLSSEDGELFRLFTWLSVVLSGVNVLVGGWPFFRAAWRGLGARVLHLDLPIALGILGVFFTSLWKVRDGRGDLAYFDTLNTFVFLMLVGRWMQQRVLERNRRFLLEDDGAEGLTVRRVEHGALTTVPVSKVRAGELLLIAPGDLVPVDSMLLDGEGQFSTDWITGESRPRQVPTGETVPAGAFNAGATALRVRAGTDYLDSPLSSLLRAGPSARSAGDGSHTRFWDLLARGWSAGVLVVASLGLWLWWPQGPQRALEISVALLVVTCPCAIGLAVPLAYELAQSRLRRVGFFIRSGDLLDKLPQVRQVLFDKTGTLTLGRLELTSRAPLESLSDDQRALAYNLASRSNHPVSRCLAAALAGSRFDETLQARELPGQGMEATVEGRVWRLGRASWAAPQTEASGTVLSVDGEPVAVFSLGEALRADARRELSALQQAGYAVWLISGDSQDRVQALARALELPAHRVLGAQRPQDKASAVEQLDRRDTLYLGDGVNDSLAFEQALCAGTPAIDRPVMPSRSDFFLVGEGLAPLRAALAVSARLRTTVRTVLGLAVAYNALAITTCLLGGMTPLRAAIAMPASSVVILLFTAWRLSGSAPAPSPVQVPAREVPA